MAGYIGSKVPVVTSGTERKQHYNITTTTTSLTGLQYTPTKVHVFHNGVRLVDGTDYTATTGTSITLTNAAENGDDVVVISYASFQTSDTVSAANGGTFAGNVTMSGDLKVDTIVNQSGDNDSGLDLSTNDVVAVKTGNTERMRVDSSGNLLVGTTTFEIRGQSSIEGFAYRVGNSLDVATTSGLTANFNRMSTDGDIVQFRKDGTTVGSIGAASGKLYISNDTGTGGIRFYNGGIAACDASGNQVDNQRDIGTITYRWDDIYATNGTIQTSDRNEKQDIAALTATEMLVAARISAMFKTFRWIDKAAENPNARTHTGIIAQDVQQAFTDEGLDAGNYALFISTTWEDENGNSQTRMGIRYPELLSFIAAYNEQRFASIETRLAALEAN